MRRSLHGSGSGSSKIWSAICDAPPTRGEGGQVRCRGSSGGGLVQSRIHTAKLLELSQDLPIVIEIVDAPEKIEAFLPDLEAMVGDGLITLERAEVLLYRPRPSRQD